MTRCLMMLVGLQRPKGLIVQRSNLIEGMLSAIKDGGPGSSIQIQGLRELLHENGRTAGRLVARMSDRAHVRSESKEHNGGFYLGWIGSLDKCPECGYEAQPKTIENPTAADFGLDGPALAIEDKTYFDR